jgi:hypothetical protein
MGLHATTWSFILQAGVEMALPMLGANPVFLPVRTRCHAVGLLPRRTDRSSPRHMHPYSFPSGLRVQQLGALLPSTSTLLLSAWLSFLPRSIKTPLVFAFPPLPSCSGLSCDIYCVTQLSPRLIVASLVRRILLHMSIPFQGSFRSE